MPIAFKSRHVVNVDDYRLPSDTDDTACIIAALNDIDANYGSWSVQPPVTSVSIPFEYILYLPAGDYRISSPITMSSSLNGLHIIGDNVVIRPANGATFVDGSNNPIFAFVHDYCYNFKMEGLSFVGFGKAVRMYKPSNIDSGRLHISNCSFHKNSVIGLEVEYTSGVAKIENSKFMDNGINLNIVSGDKVIVRECWLSNIEGGLSGLHKATIINYSRLTMESCMLIPLQPGSGSIEPAWINNYGSVTVRDTRQSGEAGSYTLVNNFAGVGDMLSGVPEPSSISVKDCQCYAVYNHSSAPSGYYQPAIVRYVSKIPNQTLIEDNRGMIQAKLIDFSYYLYNDVTSSIETMIQASGASGVVVPFNVAVKVADNVGGLARGASLVPPELWRFVRDESYLWPHKPSIALPLLNHSVDSITGAQVFKFKYPESSFSSGYEDPLLLSFSGNLNTGGWAGYRGQLVGIIKANGSYPGMIAYALNFKELFNINTDGSDPPFTVDVVWESTGTRYLSPSDSNRNFFIKIIGTDGSWDRINLAPLEAMMK